MEKENKDKLFLIYNLYLKNNVGLPEGICYIKKFLRDGYELLNNTN